MFKDRPPTYEEMQDKSRWIPMEEALEDLDIMLTNDLLDIAETKIENNRDR